MPIKFSRYASRITETDRVQLAETIRRLVESPYESHQEAWDRFMATSIRLPLCYVDAVRKVIEQGCWRAKLDPLNFIRKTAQSALFGRLDDKQRNKTKAYVGRAIDPEQKRPLARSPGPLRVLVRDGRQLVEPIIVPGPGAQDEALLFNPPKRRPYVCGGVIADLKLPSIGTDEVESASWVRLHDSAIDDFWFKSGGLWDDGRDHATLRPIAGDVLAADGQGEDDFGDRVLRGVDWGKVADKAGLDEYEREVLFLKLDGISRDSAIASRKTEKEKLAIQAAWRRLDRNWTTVVSAVISKIIKETQDDTDAALPESFISPAEVLRRLSEKRLRGSKNGAPGSPGSWLPVYTDYAR